MGNVRTMCYNSNLMQNRNKIVYRQNNMNMGIGFAIWFFVCLFFSESFILLISSTLIFLFFFLPVEQQFF